MVGATSPAAGICGIERVIDEIQEDVGRGVTELFAIARWGLLTAAASIAFARTPRVGIITGFFVPSGRPAAAETDGPIGAAVLAAGFHRLGIPCAVLTDHHCRPACRAALGAVGLEDRLESVSRAEEVAAVAARWTAEGVTHVLSIERCGRGADGVPRNMAGHSIGDHTVVLDDLFLDKPWETIAIGDGGNEIGMGAIPSHIIKTFVPRGDLIACTTPADHLIAVGVSNWGAYGLLAALAIGRNDWRSRLFGLIDPAVDQQIIDATVREGPAVDGVTGAQHTSVDGLPAARHIRKIIRLRDIVHRSPPCATRCRPPPSNGHQAATDETSVAGPVPARAELGGCRVAAGAGVPDGRVAAAAAFCRRQSL